MDICGGSMAPKFSAEEPKLLLVRLPEKGFEEIDAARGSAGLEPIGDMGGDCRKADGEKEGSCLNARRGERRSSLSEDGRAGEGIVKVGVLKAARRGERRRL